MSSSALSRRLALRWGAVTFGSAALGSVALSACSRSGANEVSSEISPFDDEVRAAEQSRFRSGRTVERNLTAAPARVNLGGRHVDTWSYGAEAVGPEIRISKGDRLNLRLQNDLSSETSVHWHGIAIRNDMDGVPPITQERIQPGAEFTYDFVAPDHGTYWYHSHSGLQADRGLFGALVVEDPNDRTGADEDVVIVIDAGWTGWEQPRMQFYVHCLRKFREDTTDTEGRRRKSTKQRSILLHNFSRTATGVRQRSAAWQRTSPIHCT